MKIAVVTRSYNQLIGGMETTTQNLCRGLVKAGHDVTVITSKSSDGCYGETIDGVHIFYAPKGKLGRHSNQFQEFVQQELTYGFDIIHVESASLRFKPKQPYVVRMHGTSIGEIKTAFKTLSFRSPLTIINQFINYPIVNKMVGGANAVVALTDKMAADLKKEYSPKKVKVIYNGVDTNVFKPSEPTNGKVILYVGRLIPEKGYQKVIELMPEIRERVPNTTFLIVGGKAHQKSNVEGVHFLGPIKHEFLPAVYNSTDIFVLPTDREEGMPMTVLEAMACGKTCVTTSKVNVVSSGWDGYVIDDPHNFKETLIELLQEDGVRNIKGKNARQTVLEKYSVDKMVADHVKLYEEVLENA